MKEQGKWNDMFHKFEFASECLNTPIKQESNHDQILVFLNGL